MDQIMVKYEHVYVLRVDGRFWVYTKGEELFGAYAYVSDAIDLAKILNICY